MELTKQHCVPCEGGTEPLTRGDAEAFLTHTPEWTLAEDATSVSRTFTFKDFKEALTFANKVGDIAEQEGHHPDMSISWSKVGITLTTHAINGLSQNDFILAAKIDQI